MNTDFIDKMSHKDLIEEVSRILSKINDCEIFKGSTDTEQILDDLNYRRCVAIIRPSSVEIRSDLTNQSVDADSLYRAYLKYCYVSNQWEPKEEEHNIWINVYKFSSSNQLSFGGASKTREELDDQSRGLIGNRIACINLKFKEGEGL